MSSKKIIRLKTPQRTYDQKKSPERTSPTVSEYLSDETIMKIKNHQFQNVHSALISELNKVYAEIQSLKHQLLRSQSTGEELASQNRLLKTRLEMLQRECELQKQKYVLERENHERLRQFYEQREKQWICILLQHRRLLEQYGNKNQSKPGKTARKQRDETQYGSLATSKSTQQALTLKNNFFLSQDAFCNTSEKLKENVNNNRKIENINSSPKTAEAYYQRAIQRLQDQDTKLLNQPAMSQINQINRQHSQGRMLSHDEQVEEIFDKVVRLTFLRFRETGLRLVQIQHSQDMVKLKKAKTSTKDRLHKTLKKLDFHFQSQNEFHIFCEHIQKCIIEQYKEFQGCYVFDFIMEKLYECQKLAVSSNSFIDKLLRLQTSKVSEYPANKPNQSRSDKSVEEKQQKASFSMDLQRRFSLLLESTIKQRSDKKQQQFKRKLMESQINEAAYSVSSLRNLSDLIKQSRGDYASNQYIS